MGTFDGADARFRRIFDANFEAIRAYCLRRLPPDEAEEATSDVFLVVWRRIDDVPTGQSARPWIFGIARNTIRDLDRKRRRALRLRARMRGLADGAEPSPERVVVAGSEYRELIEAAQRLSTHDQEILRLRLWEELSMRDIAVVMSCTEKAASKRYQRALARLAQLAEGKERPRIRPHLAQRGGEQ